MRAMSLSAATLRSELEPAQMHAPLPTMQRGRLLAATPEGDLVVDVGLSSPIPCDILLKAQPDTYCEGDEVLLFVPAGQSARGIVLGRVGLHTAATMLPQVSIEATESISLKCGQSSIDLRADGKIVIRGEDVLVRAKGTQRIRAGTVSIN